MKSYRIIWEIECVDANTPREAAEIAKDCMYNGTAQCFYVQDEKTDELFSVDLLETDDCQVLPVSNYKPVIHE